MVALSRRLNVKLVAFLFPGMIGSPIFLLFQGRRQRKVVPFLTLWF